MASGDASAAFWDKNAAGYEGDLYSSNLYELVTLGGEKLPGRCTVEALPERQFDRQKVKDHDGVSLVLRGYLPGPIDITCTIWTPEQWEKAQLVLAKHWPKPGKLADTVKKGTTGSDADLADQAALSIKHPMLNALGIQSVVIRGVSVPKPGSVPGSMEFSIKCLESVANSNNVTGAKVKGSVDAPPLAAVPGAANSTGGAIDPPSKNSSGPFGPPASIAR